MDEAVKATMNETNRPTDERAPGDPHATHDPLLVVALAADDLEAEARAEAERMVATCADCRLLFEDVRAIATATATLPAMPRRRDFRLTEGDAARLRPMGWRRFAAAFASARFAVARPAAIGLATLGLAGLIFSAIPSLGGFASAGATPPEAASANDGMYSLTGSPRLAQGPSAAASAPAGAPSAAASAAASVTAPPPASAAPQATDQGGGTNGASGGDQGAPSPPTTVVPDKTSQGPGSSGGPIAVGGYGTDTAGGVPPPDANGSGKGVPSTPEVSRTDGTGSGPAPLGVISLFLFLAGIGLFVARSAAGRIARS